MNTVERRKPTSYLRYTSLGLVWTWVYLSWKTELLFGGMTRTNIMSDASWLANVVLVIVTLFATPELVVRMGPRGRKVYLVIATALNVLGVLLSAAFAGSPASLVWRSYLAGACTGFGSGVLLAFVGAQFSRLPMEELEFAVPLNVLFVPVCSALSSPLTGTPFGPVFVALFPLFAGLLLITSPDVPAARHVAPASREMPPEQLGRRELIRTLAFCTCMEIAGASLLLTRSADNISGPFDTLASFFTATMVPVTLIVVASCVILIERSRHLDVRDACRTAIPLCIVGASAELVTGDAVALGIASVLRSIASTYLALACYIYFVRLAATGRIQPYAALGWFMGSFETGVLLGNLMGFQVLATVDAENALVIQVALAVTIYAIATLVLPDVNSPRGVQAKASDQATSRVTPDNGSDATPRANDKLLIEITPEPKTPSNSIPLYGRLERLGALATNAGLTARETEVCALLAQGRSRPYIRELLQISKNTVDTHAKHAYAKLGVHSTQELLDMLDNVDNEVSSHLTSIR